MTVLATAKQLKSDLNDIRQSILAAKELPPEAKNLLGEIVEWNRGLVDAQEARITTMTQHLADLTTTVEMLEADEAEEGISFETGTVLIAGYEQAKMVNAAVMAFLQGPSNNLDDLMTKKLTDLIVASNTSIQAAEALIAELVDSGDADDEDDADADDDEEEADEEAELVEGEE